MARLARGGFPQGVCLATSPERIGPFLLFVATVPRLFPESVAPGHLRLLLPAGAGGFVPAGIGYSSLWAGRARISLGRLRARTGPSRPPPKPRPMLGLRQRPRKTFASLISGRWVSALAVSPTSRS